VQRGTPMKTICFVAFAALVGLATAAHAAGRAENRFGSIHIDGKKAGQVHYTIQYGEAGDVESLKTRASLSILGVKLFNFEQSLHEEWRRGELHNLRARTDDDGKVYEASLERGPALYKVWHYAIVQRTLLFDLSTFKIMNVKIARSSETLKPAGKRIAAERFDFSGDWRATAWFDAKRELVQFRYIVDGHEVTVLLDD
jgi:hypothetical protein